MNSTFSTELIIVLLILIAFGEKAKQSLVTIFNLCKGKTEFSKRIETFQSRSKQLNKILEMYCEQLNAARASYFVFHNGGHDFSGIPFLKASCIDEVTCKGVSSKLLEFQNLHLAIIIDWLEDLVKDKTFYLTEKDLNENHSVAALFESRTIQAMIVAPIWKGKELAGFVIVEWLNEK